MPILDMPLEQLYEYEGRNERPADIDAYWDRAVAEMEELGTGCELIKSRFQVPNAACYDMYFTGVGGARPAGRRKSRRQPERARPPRNWPPHRCDGP